MIELIRNKIILKSTIKLVHSHDLSDNDLDDFISWFKYKCDTFDICREIIESYIASKKN